MKSVSCSTAQGNSAPLRRRTPAWSTFERSLLTAGSIDVTIEDLIITASTRPAVLAASVALLQVDTNRIAMANVRSKWPAVWVSGIEMRLVHNWVSVQSASADREWLPVSVQADLAADSEICPACFYYEFWNRIAEPWRHPDRRAVKRRFRFGE